MSDLLITNGIVVTMDPQRRVIEGGAVAIAGDRIIEVGATDALRKRHAGFEEIDATRHVVMPGLIDGHAHAGHGLVKTMGGGDGEIGRTLVRRLDGRVETLKGSDQTVLKAGEAVTVVTPTAGGFGKA